MQPDRLEHESFERPQAAAGWLARISARTRLLVALTLVVVIALPPAGWWSVAPSVPISIVHVAVGLAVAGIAVAARVSLKYLARRAAVFLAPVFLVALSIPLSRGVAGWPIMASVLAKGLLSFLVVMILVHTTGFDRLLSALRQLGTPQILIAVLASTYRYVFVLLEELECMRRAQFARTFDCPRRLSPVTIRNGTRLIAMLLLRCHERAERVHAAMLARGFDGQVRTFDEHP